MVTVALHALLKAELLPAVHTSSKKEVREAHSRVCICPRMHTHMVLLVSP